MSNTNIKKIGHVVVCVDGNRRWAHKHKLTTIEGYGLIADKLVRIIEWSFTKGALVDCLSFFLISEYNLETRQKEDVDAIVNVFVPLVDSVCKSGVVKELDLQVKIVGELDALRNYKGAKEKIITSLSMVKNHRGKVVNLLAPYNGDKELQRALERCRNEGIETSFGNLAKNWSISKIDLYLRLAQPRGWNRLSEYLPNAEKARLEGTPIYLQDLSKGQFYKMLESYLTLKDSYDKIRKK